MIDLVQDVNILRPLVFMATRDFGFAALLLVSMKFVARDSLGIWRSELDQICTETGARLELFESDLDAHRHLEGQGLLFTASESHLENHSITHDLLRHAPASYLRVTLQHGFECVGLRHSADHVRAHGETASFAADIICTWADCDQLPSLAPSQRAKVVVTGPTSLLQMPVGPVQRAPGAAGIVCENLHSVRFSTAGKAKNEFVEAFAAFAQTKAKQKRRVALRPHVGGQYFLKAQVPLPPNVQIENAPLYRIDLRQFSYGISSPSSILIDMLLADIPTAVWRDRAGNIDTSSYAGLATVTSAPEWAQFARAAEEDREAILSAQRSFLERQGMPLEPREVFSRFARIFRAAERMEVRPAGSVAERERLLLVTSGDESALKREFTAPLAPLIARGEIAAQILTERELAEPPSEQQTPPATNKLAGFLDRFGASAVIFSGYSGPAYQPIVAWARREQIPIIYHIAEDLAEASEIDAEPDRREAVTALLTSADLVCRADGGEMRVLTPKEWTSALDLLVNNADERLATVRRGRAKLDQQYSLTRVRNRLLEIIAQAHKIARAGEGCGKDKERGLCQIQ